MLIKCKFFGSKVSEIHGQTSSLVEFEFRMSAANMALVVSRAEREFFKWLRASGKSSSLDSARTPAFAACAYRLFANEMWSFDQWNFRASPCPQSHEGLTFTWPSPDRELLLPYSVNPWLTRSSILRKRFLSIEYMETIEAEYAV